MQFKIINSVVMTANSKNQKYLTEQMILRETQEEFAKIEEELRGLSDNWHEYIVFPRDFDFSLTGYGPDLFLAAFPSLSLTEIHPLMVVVKLFGTSMVLCDGIIDRTNEAWMTTKYALSFQAMQLEAYSILYSLFPANSQFWELFRSYYREYVDACITEQKFASGELPFSEYTETLALEIGANKSALAKTSVAALIELAGDDSLLASLSEAVKQDLIACQIWDDIQDWKEDLQSGTPSLLLSRVVEEWPVKCDERVLKNLTRKIFYGGHINYVIEAACQCLDRAKELTKDIPQLAWRTVAVEKLETELKSLSIDIAKICHKNIESLQK